MQTTRVGEDVGLFVQELRLLADRRTVELGQRVQSMRRVLSGLGVGTPGAIELAVATNSFDATQGLVRLIADVAVIQPRELQQRLPKLVEALGSLRNDLGATEEHDEAEHPNEMAAEIARMAARLRNDVLENASDPFFRSTAALSVNSLAW